MLNGHLFLVILGTLVFLSALTLFTQFNIIVIAQEEEVLPRLFVVNASGTAAQEIPLKATKEGDDISKVDDYDIDLNNVIQIPQGQNLIISSVGSSQGFTIVKAQLVNEQNQTSDIDLTANQRNSFSLNGISTGVYALNILVSLGDIEGGYDTVLVIVPQNQPSTTFNEDTKKMIEKRINELLVLDIYEEIIFEDRGLLSCDNPEVSSGEYCQGNGYDVDANGFLVNIPPVP